MLEDSTRGVIHALARHTRCMARRAKPEIAVPLEVAVEAFEEALLRLEMPVPGEGDDA